MIEAEAVSQSPQSEITRPKSVELELQNALLYADSIVQTVREPLVVLDADLRVKSANRSFYETFQVTAEETENKFIYALGSGQWNLPALRLLLEEILPHSSQFQDFEVELDFPSIGRRTMLLNARQIHQADNCMQIILLAIEDITERKRAEEKLKAFSLKLERSNRELQDFASVASHDLQEPLRKIQAFGDRLKIKCGDRLSDEGRDYLERMQSAARRMQALINDLLVFSRVESKAQPCVPINLAEVAREVISDLEVHIEQTGGRVEVGALPTLEADPLQMRQLLQNLIGNALKFRRAGEPPVVRVHGVVLPERRQRSLPSAGDSSAGQLCQILVTDNGIGFDEKYLDRIFTVFQRLHGRDVYEGTGIGLAVCRKIAVRHGGDITARSAPGQGATFIVTLPLKHYEQYGAI